jgi:replicative DNA helicase
LRKLGAKNLQLKVTKNRVGSTGEVPLSFVPGAGTVEERRQ